MALNITTTVYYSGSSPVYDSWAGTGLMFTAGNAYVVSSEKAALLLATKLFTESPDSCVTELPPATWDNRDIVAPAGTRQELDGNLMQTDGLGNWYPVSDADLVLQNAKSQLVEPRVMRNIGGTLTYRGANFRTIGVNAHDLFVDYLKAGTNYIADLATLAGYGVRIVRVSAMPLLAADITTYVGSNGAAPAAGYLTKLQAFLDECAKNDIGVVLSLNWSHVQLNTALLGTLADWANAASATRVFCTQFATTVVGQFVDHPAVAAWGIGNEYQNYAWTSTFTTATSTPPNTTHIAAMVSVINENVSAIRAIDPARAIIAPQGMIGGGQSVSGDFRSFARRFIASAGNADTVSIHLYPDHYTTAGKMHCFVGRDLGAAARLINTIKAEAKRLGKALIIEECNADYDSPVNSVSPISYDVQIATGTELLMDWGWYAASGGTAPDLKTTRLAVMSTIQARNSALSQSPSVLIPPYKKKFPVPPGALVVNGTIGVNGSWVKIPHDASTNPASGVPFAIMFWLKKTSRLSTGKPIIASNDGTGGIRIVSADQTGGGLEDWINFQVGYSAVYKGFSGGMNNNAPLNEWHHYAFYWDGVITGVSAMVNWIDGVVASVPNITTTGAPSATTRDFYIGAASDASVAAAMQIFDVMIISGSELTTKQVSDYLDTGAVPPGAIHRWKLNGDALDSIGTLHGVKGAAATWAKNGIS